MNKRTWQVGDIPSLEGKRVLITGANSGIGFCTAVTLARKGAHVVLACRDRGRGEEALSRLGAEAPGGAELAILDLASLGAVREFAAAELAKKEPLHLLINNAGVYAPPHRLQTQDGFEMQFGVNVLAHFALTGLLMPALELAAQEADGNGTGPRVVTIASIAHKGGKLNFEDLQSTRGYSGNKSYQQSKLADLMFAFELDRRLRAAGSGITSVAAHPGVASTELFVKGEYSALEKATRNAIGHAIGMFLNTDSEGALPTLYAATAERVKGGDYYGPQGLAEARGGNVGTAKVSQRARDKAAAARLWQVCEELTGVRFP
ncbi:MAG: oxidoreductase [Acidobacteriota bacterium]|nr:oxidoreductase [Acidobacteriota bacterium]